MSYPVQKRKSQRIAGREAKVLQQAADILANLGWTEEAELVQEISNYKAVYAAASPEEVVWVAPAHVGARTKHAYGTLSILDSIQAARRVYALQCQTQLQAGCPT